MPRSQAALYVLVKNVLALLLKERAALIKGSLDIDAMIATLQALFEDATATNAQQEAQKRQLKDTTTRLNAQERRLWILASGYLDMAIAAVGKDSEAAKNLPRYRSGIVSTSPLDAKNVLA